MAARRTPRPTDDPLRSEMARLASQYGDQELLRICLTVVQDYAQLGARKALLKRNGDPSIECEACRERKAQVEQFEKNMKQFATGRPIGGQAATEESE